MNASLVIVASNWYQELMKSIPDGQNFSLRSVFDALPRIIEKLPTTLFLTLGGALFGLVLALILAIVKINRVKVLYPIKGDTYLSPTDAYLLWDSYSSKGF